MSKKDIENANFNDTGYSYTLSLIAGKYKPVILYCLMEYEPVRFNEMQRYLKKVSDKTLSQNLKELESDNLIIRKVYPQIPPESRIFSFRKGTLSYGGCWINYAYGEWNIESNKFRIPFETGAGDSPL